MTVLVIDSRESHPGFDAEITLSEPGTRFALVGQGPWAITGVRGEHAGGFTGSPAAVPAGARPSVIVTARTDVTGDATILGSLPGRVTAIGDGQVAGYLPGLDAVAAIGPAHLGHTAGLWQNPKATRLTVEVPDEFGNSTVQAASPKPSQDGALTWTGGGGIVPMTWTFSDPIDLSNQQNAVLIIGILLGIWGSVVVAIVQFGLRSWVFGGRSQTGRSA
jgi:hypothetical protein